MQRDTGAISQLQVGKTPGVNDLATEFYSYHVGLLVPRLTDMFQQYASQGSLPELVSEAIIVSVPKLGKELDEWASYCPISLLNVNAKILQKLWPLDFLRS